MKKEDIKQALLESPLGVDFQKVTEFKDIEDAVGEKETPIGELNTYEKFCLTIAQNTADEAIIDEKAIDAELEKDNPDAKKLLELVPAFEAKKKKAKYYSKLMWKSVEKRHPDEEGKNTSIRAGFQIVRSANEEETSPGEDLFELLIGALTGKGKGEPRFRMCGKGEERHAHLENIRDKKENGFVHRLLGVKVDTKTEALAKLEEYLKADSITVAQKEKLAEEVNASPLPA